MTVQTGAILFAISAWGLLIVWLIGRWGNKLLEEIRKRS